MILIEAGVNHSNNNIGKRRFFGKQPCAVLVGTDRIQSPAVADIYKPRIGRSRVLRNMHGAVRLDLTDSRIGFQLLISSICVSRGLVFQQMQITVTLSHGHRAGAVKTAVRLHDQFRLLKRRFHEKFAVHLTDLTADLLSSFGKRNIR